MRARRALAGGFALAIFNGCSDIIPILSEKWREDVSNHNAKTSRNKSEIFLRHPFVEREKREREREREKKREP